MPEAPPEMTTGVPLRLGKVAKFDGMEGSLGFLLRLI